MSSLHKYLRFTFAIWVTLLQLLVPTTTFAQSLRQEPVEWDGMRQPVSATILPQAAPTNIKKIVAGKGDSCLLTEGGSVYCWGNTPNSSSGRIASKGSDVPTLKQGVPSGVKDIVMGDSHACLLLNDGTVKCWGSNYYGQLGKPAIKPYNESIVPTDTLPFAGKVIAIAAGANHSCALLESGAVQCWALTADSVLVQMLVRWVCREPPPSIRPPK